VAEAAVLGSLLIDPQAMTKIGPILNPEDFFDRRHRVVYEAIRGLDAEGTPADFVTLSDRIDLDKIGGLGFISGLSQNVPTSVHVESYARIVARLAVKRKIIEAGTRIINAGYDDESDDREALEQAESALFEVLQGRLGKDFQSVRSVLDDLYSKLDYVHDHKGDVTGVSTGFVDLDHITGGLQPSDLIILAARPSMGKTSLALNIAHAAAKEGRAVGFFSLEMSNEQLVQRLISMTAKVDTQRLRTGFVNEEEWGRIGDAIVEVGDIPIFIDDTAGISISEIRSKARRLCMEHNVSLLVVDYLQLAGGASRSNRVEEVSRMTRELKAVGRELGVPMLVLSQLSRACENRDNHVPMLSDLRESGSIEQDADVVAFIYRDVVYNPETERPRIADIVIAKQRNGPTDTLHLLFKEEQTRFYDLGVAA
jgi:replicative DNA helicase